ncbi:MAG: outer membrane beta-barrel protein [Betaproteobacteria bacterium AqS2]|uniref:Outer membrane beta-barrel protein n=1 Tax=Candidatus Amphirhobacter heronislandensis TaxID=1732024 RepID=A0A930UFV4_9GAMM|nr:outer membrane beta-barrel protein [Betaproteobacteria bacterium AqS2]
MTPDTDHSSSPFTNGDCGDSETSIRVFAGYKINDMISVEGFWLSSSGYATSHSGQIDFVPSVGNTTNASISFTSETDYTSFGASAVGKYEVYDNLSIKGVLGLHSYSIEPSFTPGTPSRTLTSAESTAMADFQKAKVDARTDDGVSLLYGIGAEYSLGGNFNVRAGYDVLSSGDESVSYLSAGASYTYSF